MLYGKVVVSNLVDLDVTGLVRLAGDASGAALYMARTGLGIAKISVANDLPYETTLMPVPNLRIDEIVLAASSDFWPTIVVPQWLAAAPDWAVLKVADGSCAGVIQAFGGVSHALLAGVAKQGTLDIPDILDNADYGQPRFLRGALPASADRAVIAAVADGEMLMLFPLAAADWPAQGVKLVPALSGVVFQEPSDQAALRVVYREGGRQAAILSAHGAVLGSIKLTSFDASLESLGYSIPIVAEPTVAEFDVDVRDGVYCLLAATDAAPQLILFDRAGATLKLDWPADGLGAGRWMTSPTVLKAPAASSFGFGRSKQGQGPAFLFAFIEMADEGPVGIRLGAIMQ